MSSPARIAIGVSACLLGQHVRYDGGHKADAIVTARLGSHWDLVPICPELAVGLGVPRPPIQLRQSVDGKTRAVGIYDEQLDPSESLLGLGHRLGHQLQHLCGYVFKARSPSCGLYTVPVTRADGTVLENGMGLYARGFLERRPGMPVEEEGNLNVPQRYENFIERICFYRRWLDLTTKGMPRSGALVTFHTRHKFQFLAHDQAGYRELGRWIAQLGGRWHKDFDPNEYLVLAMGTLSVSPSAGNHVNSLQHLLGFFKTSRSQQERNELTRKFEAYGSGIGSLLPLLDELRAWAARDRQDYVAEQSYLNPTLAERDLRVWR
ncbi:MAG: DUF523 and DUF1722 domain-containing protein [Chromatiales bacterium]|nr:DUF523 and DUF1722 domain-containing protein [Chromatiales bacterium]